MNMTSKTIPTIIVMVLAAMVSIITISQIGWICPSVCPSDWDKREMPFVSPFPKGTYERHFQTQRRGQECDFSSEVGTPRLPFSLENRTLCGFIPVPHIAFVKLVIGLFCISLSDYRHWLSRCECLYQMDLRSMAILAANSCRVCRVLGVHIKNCKTTRGGPVDMPAKLRIIRDVKILDPFGPASRYLSTANRTVQPSAVTGGRSGYRARSLSGLESPRKREPPLIPAVDSSPLLWASVSIAMEILYHDC